MRPPRVRQTVDPVHRRLTDRKLRRIDDHRLPIVVLDQPPGVVGIGLHVDQPRGLGKGRLSVRTSFVASGAPEPSAGGVSEAPSA